MTIVKLSDRRWQIKRGAKTFYVHCTELPREAGEGWNGWTRTGPEGSEPLKGFYTVDDGERKTAVEAWTPEEAVERSEAPSGTGCLVGTPSSAGIVFGRTTIAGAP